MFELTVPDLYCCFTVDIPLYISNLCRFLLYWNGSSASWIITLMSIERFLAIYFPLKIKILTSKTKVTLAMVNIFAFAAAVNLHFFWTYELKQHKTAKYCVSVSKYWSFLTQYWPWIILSFYSLVPFIILISTSTAILVKIVHSNYVRKHSMNISDGGVDLTNMTLTLLSVSFVFLLATGPYVILRYGSLYYFFNTGFCLYLIEDKDKNDIASPTQPTLVAESVSLSDIRGGSRISRKGANPKDQLFDRSFLQTART